MIDVFCLQNNWIHWSEEKNKSARKIWDYGSFVFGRKTVTPVLQA